MATPIYIFDRSENLRLVIEPKNHTELTKEDTERPLFYSFGQFIEELNGQETLEFHVPYTDKDVDVELIEGDGRAVIRHPTEGYFVEFVIRTPTDINGHNGIVKEVFCEDSEYELNDAWITGYSPSEPVDLRTALNAVLQGTRFEPGEVMETDERLPRLGPMSVKRAITELIALYGGEKRKRVEFRGNRITRRFIDIFSRRGQFTGKRWEYGKDIQNIRREVDYTGIKTALYGFGQSTENDGPRIDFANVVWSKANGDPVDKPAGQKWVGDPEALARYGYDGGTRHRFGMHDSQAEDPGQLLLETWQDLQRRNKPNSTYEMDVILLERLTGRGHEKVRLGDGTYVIDRAMKPAAELEAHVISIEHDLGYPTRSKVLLGNFRESFFVESERIRSVERIVSDRQGNWDHKETPAGAQEKANQAKSEAIQYAEQRIQEAEHEIESAKQRLDEAENRITQAEQDIVQVDQRITEEVNRLEQHVIPEVEQSAKNFTIQYAERKVSRGAQPPNSPQMHDLWIDTSVSPSVWYQYNGTTWEKLTRTSFSEIEGQVITPQLADNAVTLDKMASGLRPIQVVSTLPNLPNPDFPQGATVFLTTDNKLYRSTGSTWTSAIPAADLTGEIVSTQIADNAITTPKIVANAVTAAKIAANAVTADKIEAGAVETGHIAANAVTADKIAANTITTNHISSAGLDAGVITTGLLDAARIQVGPGTTFAPGYDPLTKVNLGTMYNNVRIDSSIGLEAVRSNNLVRTVMNATNGIAIQRRTNTSSPWSTVFWADENGDLRLAGKIVTQGGGVFDGDIVARNITLAGSISAQNAVITGTIVGSGARFQRIDIERANIIDANIQNATITGDIVAGRILSNTTIDVATDVRIGNTLYIGNPNAITTQKAIQFSTAASIRTNTDSGDLDVQTNGTLALRAVGSDGDVNILASRDVFISAGRIIQFDGHVDFTGSVSGLSTTIAGSHSHTASMGISGEHNHGGSTGSAGGHNHGLTPGHQIRMRNPSTGAEYWATYNAAPDHNHSIMSSGEHVHSVTINSAGAHSHSVQ